MHIVVLYYWTNAHNDNEYGGWKQSDIFKAQFVPKIRPGLLFNIFSDLPVILWLGFSCFFQLFLRVEFLCVIFSCTAWWCMKVAPHSLVHTIFPSQTTCLSVNIFSTDLKEQLNTSWKSLWLKWYDCTREGGCFLSRQECLFLLPRMWSCNLFMATVTFKQWQ